MPPRQFCMLERRRPLFRANPPTRRLRIDLIHCLRLRVRGAFREREAATSLISEP